MPQQKPIQKPPGDPWAGVDAIPVQDATRDDPWAGVDAIPVNHPEEPARSPSGLSPLATRIGTAVKDAIVGVVKGTGQSVVNLGYLAHMVPGVSWAVDELYGVPGISREAFARVNDALAPTNTTQAVGKFAEQVAEVVVPSKAITSAATNAAVRLAPRVAPAVAAAGRLSPMLGKVTGAAAEIVPRAAVEAAGGAGIAAVQGGDIGTGAAISGAIPVVGGVARKLGTVLKSQAAKQVSQGLGATKEYFKAESEKITPEFLKRGIHGGREAIQAQAAEMVEEVGPRVDAVLQKFAKNTVGGAQPILDALKGAQDKFVTYGRFSGRELARQSPEVWKTARQVGPDLFETTVVTDTRAYRQLSLLQRAIEGLGGDPTVEQLVAVRRAWDSVVAKVGGYAHRAPSAIGLPLKEQTEAWAKREGANAIRRLLADQVPDLSAVNKEYAFWASLDEILSQTLKRTRPQGQGVKSLAVEGAGQIAGSVVGAPAGVPGQIGSAFLVGKLAKMAEKVIHSPRWQFASAQVKDRLANAIMDGKTDDVARILSRVGSSQAAQAAGSASGIGGIR